MSTGDPSSAAKPLSAMGSMAKYQASYSENSDKASNTARVRDTGSEDIMSCRTAAFAAESDAPKIQHSIPELKHLRDKLPSVVCNLFKMKDSAGGKYSSSDSVETHLLIDYTDILTLPYGIVANPNPQPIATRKLKQLPRGNEMRSRFDPIRKSTEDSDNEEVVFRGHPSRKALGLSTQWQYRRSERSLTDDAKSLQPQMAPVGIDAQKAENFRKFYRAVVSPTHVRVTAGGRIVPNSRAPAQPVFVWNKDRVAFDTVASSTDAAARLNGESQAGPKRFQSTNSSFETAGQTSSRSSYQKSDSSATAQSLESKDVNAQYKTSGSTTTQPPAAPIGVKFSDPENFDRTKPFFLNGHMVVPIPRGVQLPPGLPVVPLSMIGIPSQQQMPYQQQQQQAMGAFHATSPAFGVSQNQNQRFMPGMSGPSAYPHVAPSQFIHGPQALQVAGGKLQHHKSTPAMSSNVYRVDRLSPKTMNAQLKSFEDEIKRIDHQIKYNTHQTDEKHENQKRQYILEQIGRLKEQLGALGFAPIIPEPRQSVQDRRIAASALKTLDLTKSLDGVDSFGEPTGISSGKSTDLKTQTTLRQLASDSVISSIPSITDSSDFRRTPEITTSLVSTDSKPAVVSKKRLSPSAARAPEFKPRSHLAAELTSNPAAAANDTILFTTPVKGAMDYQKAAGTSVPVSSSAFYQMEHPQASMLSYSRDFLPANARGSGSESYHSATTYQQAPLSVQASVSANVGPYLSGYIQPGLHEAGVMGQQFQYSRPLTDSELLARKLYWGNGGKQHQHKGLPKFDGKDFYPPSPTKPSNAFVNQSRASEASTVVRKYNSSAVTSKASEESGVLQKLSEEETPVTPRMNHINRKASAPVLDLNKTEENKENLEIIKDTEDLDAWCAKNDIHMPDGGTPITRTRTAALLAKLANIPSPKFRLTRDPKPASVASERSDSYSLPRLLARGASKPVAAASGEFATGRPSAFTQASGLSSMLKLPASTPVVVDALPEGPSQEGLRRPASKSKSIRSVSGSFPSTSVSDTAMGTFTASAVGRTEPVLKAGELDSRGGIRFPIRSTAATEYLQKVARNDARRTQETQMLEEQIIVAQASQAPMSTIPSLSLALIPGDGAFSTTAAESMAAHQKAYLAKNLPLHPRPYDGIGYIGPPFGAEEQTAEASKLVVHAAPAYAAASSVSTEHAPPAQILQQQMHYPHPMQFQYPGPPMPYQVLPGQLPYAVQMSQGQQYPGQMPVGQPYPGPPQGQWIWQQGPAFPPQGPPPAR